MDPISLWKFYASLFVFLSLYALFWYVCGWQDAWARILPPPPRRPRWDLTRRFHAALAALLRAVTLALFGGPPRDGGSGSGAVVACVRVVPAHPPAAPVGEVVEEPVVRMTASVESERPKVGQLGLHVGRVVGVQEPVLVPWWARGSSVETSP